MYRFENLQTRACCELPPSGRAECLNKGAIVYFYPKAGSPACTSEACDFRDSEAALEAAGYSVVGISPDTPEQLKAFADKQKLPFTLISDADHKIAAK